MSGCRVPSGRTVLTLALFVGMAPLWAPLSELGVGSLAGPVPTCGKPIETQNTSLRLTSHPALDYHPAFSPDGTRILFTSQRSGEPSLWIVPAKGGDAIPVPIEGSGDFYSSWAPDGRSIAVDMREAGGPPDLYRYWFGNGELARLTDFPAMDAHPAFSPNGREIVFTSTRGGSMDLWIMNADGTLPRPLLEDTPQDWHPSWSPDGHRILFESDRGGGESQIWVMNRDGSELRQVTHGPAQATRAAWSPDGSLVLFGREEDLWVVNPDGGEPVCLLGGPAREGNGAWSPDGTRIVVSLYDGTNSDLWVFVPDRESLDRARQNRRSAS